MDRFNESSFEEFSSGRWLWDRTQSGEHGPEPPKPRIEILICQGCGERCTSLQPARWDPDVLVGDCCSPPSCPSCGQTGGTPIELEDSDRATGYRSIESFCSLCDPRTMAREAESAEEAAFYLAMEDPMPCPTRSALIASAPTVRRLARALAGHEAVCAACGSDRATVAEARITLDQPNAACCEPRKVA